MRRRGWLVPVAVMLVACAALGPTPAGAEPTVVGIDAELDWGNDPDLAPIGDSLGQDLISASIEAGADDTINFIIGLRSLPASGGAPEVSRYVWDLDVVTPTSPDGKLVELDGKYTNYSRGVCDPTAGACPPPRDPGAQPFFIRGNCVANPGGVTTCQELGVVQGVFDATAATITIPVPLSLLGEAECPKTIAPGVNIFGGSVSASPSAFFSSSGAPLDFMDLGIDDFDGSFAVC